MGKCLCRNTYWFHFLSFLWKSWDYFVRNGVWTMLQIAVCNRRLSWGWFLLFSPVITRPFLDGSLSFTVKIMEDLQKYKHNLMKSFKRSWVTLTPQLPVSLSTHLTVVVGDLSRKKEHALHMHYVKTKIRSKEVPTFPLTPLIGSHRSSSSRCISGCVPGHRWEKKGIKCHVWPSPY